MLTYAGCGPKLWTREIDLLTNIIGRLLQTLGIISKILINYEVSDFVIWIPSAGDIWKAIQTNLTWTCRQYYLIKIIPEKYYY